MQAQPHRHPEAFCLMQYQSDDGTETEVIWNSRDGVTPFIVTLPSGKQATHVRWGEDVRVSVTMARALGVRWFVDATRENMVDAALEWVEKYWDHPDYPISRRWSTKREAIDFTLDSWVGEGGHPTLIDAPEESHV